MAITNGNMDTPLKSIYLSTLEAGGFIISILNQNKIISQSQFIKS